MPDVNTKINVKLASDVNLLVNPRLACRRDLGAGASGIGTGGLVGVLNYKPTNGLRAFTSYDDESQDFSVERYWKLANMLWTTSIRIIC